MPTPDYVASEKFIWDELIRQAEQGIRGLFKTWKRKRRIDPFVIAWPATVVQDKDGIDLEGPVVRELGGDPSRWLQEMVDVVKLANAYALLQVQQQGVKRVRVLLESHHGARCWTLPITHRGDVQVLGRPTWANNDEHLGLLWRPGPEAS